MMNGLGMFMMSAWIPFIVLFWVIVIAAVVWLVMRALNKQKTPTTFYSTKERVDQPYAQGYQPRRSMPEPKSEEQVSYPRPEDEQPHVQYPQSQEMPTQQ